MKANKFWSIFIMLVFVFGATLVFSSCSKDKNPLVGTTWNLKDYGDASVATNPESYVTWGEYMKFTSTRLIWNNRLCGNTTYKITWTDAKTFAAVNVDDPSDARAFYVVSRTSSVLVIYETGDDLYRYLTKK